MKIILLMAMTADGIIARDAQQLVDWTGKQDKKYFVEITKQAGVMIMGSKTFDTIGKALPGRKNIVMTTNPARQSDNPDLRFTSDSPEQIVAGLEEQGFDSAALIGGAVINTLFMRKNLVNEVHLTVVPAFFGKGLTLFREQLDVALELMDAVKLNHTHVLLKYKVKI